MATPAADLFDTTRTLLTRDRVRLRAGLRRGCDPASDTAIVLVHGFNATITRPDNTRALSILAESLPVVAVELRGHGASQGLCTLGDKEVLDVEAAVVWARTLGYRSVVTVGFSMGAAIVVRHAAALGGVAAVVAVSGPAFWNYRGTPIMRMLHFGVENPVARQYLSRVMRTRVIPPPWPQPWPEPPAVVAAAIPPTPLLIVHGTQDGFFPVEHPAAIARSAAAGAAERGVADRTDVWLRDFGHAEAAIDDALLRAIGDWVRQAALAGPAPGSARSTR